MEIELRSDDSVRISGYVNVPGKESRPVITRHGKVNELIEERAFDRAIGKADHIDVLLDHNNDRKLSSTADKTAEIYEDNVGLFVNMETRDTEVIEAAKAGKLKGWSFNLRAVIDEVEQRANKLPLRKVKDFIMDEVSLILHKNPAYNATSIIEVRADNSEEEIEIRSSSDNNIKTTVIEVRKEPEQEETKSIDYSNYYNKINQLKVG